MDGDHPPQISQQRFRGVLGGGRAEALIDHGDPHEAHRTYRAPFIAVGEGARKIR
jgi:hypothetical protein